MPETTVIYTRGHHESTLRSHSWHTAQNSASYLLSYIKPNMHILDIGCGTGLKPHAEYEGMCVGSSA
ncbi:hypothetical protein EDB19DRAFT_1780445 [Suillus lakei]|nr:hypothetical protein EDB19DRAFT_1780445 [Suillus lakei]